MGTWTYNIRGAEHQIDAQTQAEADTKAIRLSQQPQHFAFDESQVPANQRSISDPVKEIGYGLREAIDAVGGMGGDLYDLGQVGMNKLADATGMPGFVHRGINNDFNAGRDGPLRLPTSAEFDKSVMEPMLGSPVPPSADPVDQGLRTAGNFGLGLLAPGGPARKALNVLLPTAGSEAGEKLTEGTRFAPYGKMVGGLVGSALTLPRAGVAAPVKEAAKDIGVRSQDMTRIIRQAQRDGLTPTQIQAKLAELGPDATLMDVGPNLRQEGQRIVAKGGEGRATITDALTQREAGANQRIRSAIDDNLGPAPVPSRVDAGLRRSQQSLSPQYESALGGATAVDTEAIGNDIQSMIANTRGEARSALERVRDMLRIPGTDQFDPHPRAALATRQAIDGMIGSTQDGNVRRILTQFRGRLDAELASAAPGLKEVDAKFANLAGQREAFERGRSALDSGRSSPTPTDLAADAAGSPATKFRLGQGARADIERIIGTNANDRVALQRVIKGEGDWNPQKLATLFGQDKADRILAVLDREKTFDLTSNRVIKNSATAERLPEENGPSFGVREAVMSGGPKALAYSGLIRGVETVIDKIKGDAAALRDAGVARILANADPQKVATALLKANGGKPLPAERIEPMMRALLQGPGTSADQRR
jgi:hypothetical protein